MLRYVLIRIASLVPVLIILIVVSTFMMRFAKGSPFASEKTMDPEMQKRIEKKWGLDETGWVYICEYLKGMP